MIVFFCKFALNGLPEGKECAGEVMDERGGGAISQEGSCWKDKNGFC